MNKLIKEVKGDEIIAKITKIKGGRIPYRVTFHDVDTNEIIVTYLLDTIEQAEDVIAKAFTPEKIWAPV